MNQIINNNTDPFTNITYAALRLWDEYKKHPRLIVSVDFDDTVFDFHNKGASYERVFNLLKKCAAHKFYIVLWTASDQSRHEFMRSYMKEKDIVVDAINENPIPLPFGNHKKMYYNILLDDRAGLGQAVETLEMLFRMIEGSPNNHDGGLSECNRHLYKIGKAHPRTCVQCGFSSCKYGI